MSSTSDIYRQPTVFGEVLFDCFPDDCNVLGGAPFNVAWHLQGFGDSPRFISRIGNDDLGNRVVAEMQQWGMTTTDLQRGASHPTGRVDITISGDTHQFNILPEQAYDHIHTAELRPNINSPLLYHGSLILRSADSARALASLKQAGTPVFLDINLREPWLPADIPALLREATWLKLNEDEFHSIAPKTMKLDAVGLPELRRHFDLQGVITTCGAAGAWWCDATSCTFYPAPIVEAFVDSVGAGDAFAAVAIFGLLQGWPSNKLMQRAGQFAAQICANRGATTKDRLLYNRTVMSWRNGDD